METRWPDEGKLARELEQLTRKFDEYQIDALLIGAFAVRALNFSTLPAVSIIFSLPVKKGWQALQISTSIFSWVDPVLNWLPQAHLTVA